MHYGYWLKPDGHRTRDEKYAPVSALAKIGIESKLNEDRSISWPAFRVRSAELTLRGSFSVFNARDKCELNDADANEIGREAIRTIIRSNGGGKPVRPHEFLREADKSASAYYRRTSAAFRLVTSLSVAQFPAECIEIDSLRIAPLKARSMLRLLPLVLQAHLSGTPHEAHFQNTKYQILRIETHSRSQNAAVAQALRGLDLLRGVWSLYATFGSWTISFGHMKSLPVGVIHRGPIQILQNVEDSATCDGFWYDSDFVGDQKLFDPGDRWPVLEKQRRQAMRSIRASPYRAELEDLLVRYVAGLDDPNLDAAFLKMWSLLERITDTVGQPYQKTIERATWSVPKPMEMKEALNALRIRRNRLVHAARTGEEADQAVYQLKQFVDFHLVRLVGNVADISSLAEYGRFLDLPTDTAMLKRRRRTISRALRLLEK